MRYHRSLVLALATLTIGVTGLVACGDDDDASDDASATEAPAGTEAAATGGDLVVMADLAFEPSTLEVAAGTEVTWENRDTLPHRIASADGTFDSEDLSAGDTFSHTFDSAGEFSYICGIHPSMTGTIVVG